MAVDLRTDFTTNGEGGEPWPLRYAWIRTAAAPAVTGVACLVPLNRVNANKPLPPPDQTGPEAYAKAPTCKTSGFGTPRGVGPRALHEMTSLWNPPKARLVWLRLAVAPTVIARVLKPGSVTVPYTVAALRPS